VGPRGAVVLGADYSALGLVQSLGSQGIGVTVVHPRRGIAAHSSWARFRRCPDLLVDPESWITRLRDICREHPSPPVLLASADPEARALAHGEPRLADVARVRTHPEDTIEKVLDKASFGDWATSLGLSAPPTRRADLFARGPRGRSWPLVAKPRFRGRARASQAGGLDRFALLPTVSEWSEFRVRHAGRLHEVVLQEYLPGTSADMYSVGVCADRGAVRAMFTGHKIRGYPALFGDTIVGESAVLRPGERRLPPHRAQPTSLVVDRRHRGRGVRPAARRMGARVRRADRARSHTLLPPAGALRPSDPRLPQRLFPLPARLP
jgi:predicted ATP-grasp superfamily ATP-dependent carboligase